MGELSIEVKETMKSKRLEQYQVQIFAIEMDIVAFTAVGDTEQVVKSEKELAILQQAYAAVEAM